ncbi:MAG: MerR family transcriptional regulator [Pirellulaceae bacterium]
MGIDGEQLMMKKAGFVSVKEASEILDVAPNTVRSWGANGTITEYRHPANNYRLYKKAELVKLVKQAQSPIVVQSLGKKVN